MRIWQAKRETSIGALAALSELRTAQQARDSNGRVASALHETLQGLARQVERAASEEERKRIAEERDVFKKRYEDLLPRSKEDGRRYVQRQLAQRTRLLVELAVLKADGG